jgi:hypothetical protein
MNQSVKIIKKVTSLKNILNSDKQAHIWQFSRVGGVNRVNIETGMDLVSLEYLDQKLWTALSCPVHGLEIDAKTLELIDSDHDERIRVPEILAAVKWLTSMIKNPDDLVNEHDSLVLSAIDDSKEEGQNLIESAKQILTNLNKPDAKEITVEETSDTARIFANTKFNGDGIITEDSTDDDKIKELINDIIACTGSAIDRNGKSGVTIDHINTFYQDCEDFSNWHAKAEARISEILPFGDATAEAFEALLVIKAKIDDYFLRCRLAAFDEESTISLNSLQARYQQISDKDLSSCVDEIAGFPLSKIEANKALPLLEDINPVWEKALSQFKMLIIDSLFPNKNELSEKEWQIISKKFDEYNLWLSEKKGEAVESLGLIYVRELLSDNTKTILCDLIAKDNELEQNTNNIFLVDKLVRYYRDLHKLLKNYVTFYDFYLPNSSAIFQAGSLYIDQRCCDLCIRVNNMEKHNVIARSSGICLIYCECFSKSKNEKMTIVAALTDGDFDNIEVGRNAIFYDRQGNDWDATIIKVVENPISIRQAFWTPYRRVSRFISIQIEKFASAKDKEVASATTGNIEAATNKADAGLKNSIKASSETNAASNAAPAATHQPFDIGKFVGIFAALSLAMGAIGSVITSILTGFLKLTWWKMPLAVLGVILCISGPSMILAWLKLRKRNLAPILDANGWAINARVTINIPFGNTLTHLASLPSNAKLNLIDPFAKKRNPFLPYMIGFIIILIVAVFLFWYFGYFHKWSIF